MKICSISMNISNYLVYNTIFSCNEIDTFNIDLNNISLDNNFDEDDSDTIILIIIPDFWLGIVNLKNGKQLKNDKWRINAIAWHTKDGRILVCQKIRKKKWSRFLQSTAFNVYNVRTLEHFDRWRFDLFIL